ncbi:hypothetical protein Tco_1324982, partial [Tanacetum coccineum]
ENPIEAGIVRIEDAVPSTVVEKARGTRKKRKAAGGTSGSILPPKNLRADHGSSGASASTGGKSVVALQGLLERSILPVEVGVTAVATLSFITSSVSLTPEREGDGRTDSITGPDLRTQHQLRGIGPVQHSIFRDSASLSTVGADVVGPSQPSDYDQLFTEFNVRVARQACFSVEVRLRS